MERKVWEMDNHPAIKWCKGRDGKWIFIRPKPGLLILPVKHCGVKIQGLAAKLWGSKSVGHHQATAADLHGSHAGATCPESCPQSNSKSQDR